MSLSTLISVLASVAAALYFAYRITVGSLMASATIRVESTRTRAYGDPDNKDDAVVVSVIIKRNEYWTIRLLPGAIHLSWCLIGTDDALPRAKIQVYHIDTYHLCVNNLVFSPRNAFRSGNLRERLFYDPHLSLAPKDEIYFSGILIVPPAAPA